MNKTIILSSLLILMSCGSKKMENTEMKSISGIYPKLAHYNDEGECGTGAVVPWAENLWVITYGPHKPLGSSDKLYQVKSDYTQENFAKSIGGTPANRMIHKESNQLLIGPYVIDAKGNVRVISIKDMPGRLTGNARDLTDPENKVYYGTMEEGLYEVDVHSLAVKELYPDGNFLHEKKSDTDSGPINDMLPGVHGKGLYSGQGHLYFTNNGEGTKAALTNFSITAGVLAEWDGKDWKVVRRNQFTEVTGPGGIYGNGNSKTDPIWSIGWDYKSLILGVRDATKGWSFYRLPKASHSYDGAHGWNTEWPRIRNVGTEENPDYLMTMHGMFWHFPATFTANNSKGIRPRSSYLKVIGDFCRWQNQLVFGCDDTAQNEFLNKRNQKGNLSSPGQSNSNLWFTTIDQPDHLGPTTANGTLWSDEKVKANVYSEPFLFAGWPKREAWIQNNGTKPVTFTLEIDKEGNGKWETVQKVKLASTLSTTIDFSTTLKGEWIRVKTDKNTKATFCLNYTANNNRTNSIDPIFEGLSPVDSNESIGGMLYSLGDNRRSLGVLAMDYKDNSPLVSGYYEMDDQLRLVKKEDPKMVSFMKEHVAIPKQVIQIEKGSVLIIDNSGRRWRLPLGLSAYTKPTNEGAVRICREVATERDLFSCMGTFYELPAENADGFAKIRPISTHEFKINDYVSYRGMLIMTGVDPQRIESNDHLIYSADKKAVVWAGVLDDLWKLGKPTGFGGPWMDTSVKANEYSDPYLISFYDKKDLKISHNSNETVTFTLEVDPSGNGNWMKYKVVSVKKGQTFNFEFPSSFQAKWIRFKTDKDTNAKTLLSYE
ncbi:MAG: hypothetical protein WCR45_07130 [Bacteroidaceae bacterium]|nr:hypothetical protein [Bacteroidaceae bacterium]